MARPFLVRAFTEELPLKVVSLVIAVSLFAIVRSDKDAATAAYVKVIYTLPRDRVLASEPVSEVRVGVRGPWTRLSRFDDRAVEPIRIDLTNRQAGVLRFDEGMVKLPAGLRVASISPSEVKLDFEPKVSRLVPVQPLAEGQPADGFRVVRVTALPSEVRVVGARRAVEQLKAVPTRPLRIEGAESPVRGEVRLDLETRLVELEVQAVQVTAEIAPAIVERTLDEVPIKILGLSRLEGQVEPQAARVIVRGPSQLIGGVTVETVSLAVDGQLVDTRPASKYLRPVAVNGLPAGVSAEVQPDTVMLSTHRKRD